MAQHNDLGRYGELIGTQYLEQQHYAILHRNWKYSYFEIDVIASKSNVLHFIEIKTRRSLRYGLPEEDADRKKWRNVMKAADVFQRRNPHWKLIQYDVLSIQVSDAKEPQFLLIEDIYFW